MNSSNKVGVSEPPTHSFEVEVHVGGRAVDIQGADRATRPSTPVSPLAAQRQTRARRRRQLAGVVILVISLALVMWGTAIWWKPLFEGDVVARVNGQPITMTQIEREIKLSKALAVAATGKEQQESSPPSMMEQLILLELKAQAAQRMNFAVSSEDIDAAADELVSEAMTTRQKLAESMKTYGLTDEDLRAHLNNVVLVNRFAQQYVVNGITDSATRFGKLDRWQNDLLQMANIQRLRNPTTSNAPKVGSKAPDFALKDLNGKEVRLSSLQGKPVVINVWAPWCPPCRAEMPVLESIYKSNGGGAPNGDGFELLAVAIQSEPSNVTAFVREFGITFPVLLDAKNEVTDLYQVGPIPTSFFIDRQGTIRAIQIGQLNESALQERIASIK